MIDTIHIIALKSIKDLTVKCSKLNLFVGTNSSGKSTLLQGLLLVAQQKLNGKYISIGDFREVRNYYMPNSSIRIEIKENGKNNPAWIEFIEDKENETYNVQTSLDEIPAEDILIFDDIDDSEQSDLISDEFGFHYLSCHRIGVTDIYAKNMLNESDFGIDGEYAMAYLLKNESKNVENELVVEGADVTNSLLEQVNYWLNYIVGTTLAINDIKKTNYLQVKYNNNPANASSEALYCRPINVGSGISYLISIIISCLGSEEDSIIVIENPEIHLHPKAQSRLCDFLYFVSKAGRQLFVETHSDHIFNGLRVGVATKKIQQEDISVNFLAMNEHCETQCNPIIFKEYGKIVGTNDEMDIDDLFDQFEIDLNRMLGL
ncbi:MAG: AAA family ATPase [Mediterraneibacter sp.]